ncbi:hypothetical protein [Paenibacillus macerans]|uniref:hypothetical protein n=1 Tax=Paenibacillus macerans TaxID=44252 RepID=UPI0020414551|nr:hypothetical protein [Paenibacillus macerans]MCM3701440.1 hypothetical protein [Paenibacillus macerans]
MSEEKKKPFSDPRWNDPGKPKIIGYNEIPEKEQKENKELFRGHLKKIGVLKDEK